MSASWQHKTSVVIALGITNNRNSAFIHGQKLLWKNCGIKHHTPWDPGTVSSTYGSGDKQTDLSSGCGPSVLAVAHELASAPFSHTWGTPERHYLRKLSMDERAYVKVQMFRRKIGAYCYSKNISLDTLPWKAVSKEWKWWQLLQM